VKREAQSVKTKPFLW